MRMARWNFAIKHLKCLDCVCLCVCVQTMAKTGDFMRSVWTLPRRNRRQCSPHIEFLHSKQCKPRARWIGELKLNVFIAKLIPEKNETNAFTRKALWFFFCCASRGVEIAQYTKNFRLFFCLRPKILTKKKRNGFNSVVDEDARSKVDFRHFCVDDGMEWNGMRWNHFVRNQITFLWLWYSFLDVVVFCSYQIRSIANILSITDAFIPIRA